MDSKRRLPLLPRDPPAAAGGDADEPRPPWHWVGFGAVAIFTVWLPLSAVAGALAARVATVQGGDEGKLAGAGAAIVAMHAAALAMGAFAGGLVVGRWGGDGVGVREAAFSGVVAALAAVGVAWASSGFSAGALLVVAVAAPFAALGGLCGLRLRTGAGARPPR